MNELNRRSFFGLARALIAIVIAPRSVKARPEPVDDTLEPADFSKLRKTKLSPSDLENYRRRMHSMCEMSEEDAHEAIALYYRDEVDPVFKAFRTACERGDGEGKE